MRAKITRRTVEAQRPGARDVLLWHTELPGFGVKVTPRGSSIYVFQYSRAGADRRVTIGRHGIDKTSEEARREFLRLRGLVADGRDPAMELRSARAAPTLAKFAVRYLEEHARPNKKSRSVEEDVRNLDKHILPVLGRSRIVDVSRQDMVRFHQSLKATPVAANRCIALLSAMFNLAEKWGVRPDGTNPTRHVSKFHERKVERFLSDTLPDSKTGAEVIPLGTLGPSAIDRLHDRCDPEAFHFRSTADLTDLAKRSDSSILNCTP